jgi:hypothetical protein
MHRVWVAQRFGAAITGLFQPRLQPLRELARVERAVLPAAFDLGCAESFILSHIPERDTLAPAPELCRAMR